MMGATFLVIDGPGGIVASAGAHPPDPIGFVGFAHEWSSKIRAGLLAWPFLWGLASFGRALKLEKQFDWKAFQTTHPHDFILAMVAVAKSERKKGLGKAIVQQVRIRSGPDKVSFSQLRSLYNV